MPRQPSPLAAYSGRPRGPCGGRRGVITLSALVPSENRRYAHTAAVSSGRKDRNTSNHKPLVCFSGARLYFSVLLFIKGPEGEPTPPSPQRLHAKDPSQPRGFGTLWHKVASGVVLIGEGPRITGVSGSQGLSTQIFPRENPGDP